MPELVIGGTPVRCAAVLFDKDGTLIDYVSTWLPMLRTRLDLLVELGVLEPAGRPAVMEALGVKSDTLAIDPAGRFATATRNEVIAFLADLLARPGRGAGETRRLVEQAFERAEELSPRGELAKPVPALRQTLESLRNAGCLLAVATADRRQHALWALEALGVAGFFEAVVGIDDVDWVNKPAPDLALEACRRLGVAPGEAVVVGDTVLDMEMARAAGARLAVAVLTGFTPEEDLIRAADVVLPDLSQIRVAPA